MFSIFQMLTTISNLKKTSLKINITTARKQWTYSTTALLESDSTENEEVQPFSGSVPIQHYVLHVEKDDMCKHVVTHERG